MIKASVQIHSPIPYTSSHTAYMLNIHSEHEVCHYQKSSVGCTQCHFFFFVEEDKEFPVLQQLLRSFLLIPSSENSRL